MHLFRIWFQRLPDIRNFAVYFLALWPIIQLIPTPQEKSCSKAVLRVNLWVKFRYSGIGFFGVWGHRRQSYLLRRWRHHDESSPLSGVKQTLSPILPYKKSVYGNDTFYIRSVYVFINSVTRFRIFYTILFFAIFF